MFAIDLELEQVRKPSEAHIDKRDSDLASDA